jgi:carboxyl-terminal processing protease
MTQLAPYIFFQAGLDYKNFDPRTFGALRYTTNKFYRVSGSSTQLKGVVPDIVLPSINDYLEVGEGSLENALAWDPIDPVEFEKVNRVKPYLAELEKRSVSRVAASKDFAYVKEDIELVKKAVAEKSVSLNEQLRLKEKNEQEARARARDRELKSRKLPTEKIFDLTIKDDEVQMKQETNAVLAAIAPASNGLPLKRASKSAKAAASPATNSIKIANSDAPLPPDADSDEVAPEDKAPVNDVELNEVESILSDYILLMRAESPLTAEQKTAVH